ncbi:hypothetical protein BXZ70DRAFT_904387 [Cristinia sonorae]|uniref:Uncharacterized protein n=1 Tax=Cristinia sonorae TaxID=1940300 RepID=A0A8K0XT98_9AGAR|nr:hypothetical protein BXZ70DRAFT_904387 [Cristinia sonorae]
MPFASQYEQIHKDLDKAIQNPTQLTNQQKVNSLEKISNDVSTPGAEKQLIHEIDDLAHSAMDLGNCKTMYLESAILRNTRILRMRNNALSTETSLGKIAALFDKIKTDGAEPDFIEDLNSLKSTWQGDRKTYVDLLWESKQVAGSARATIEGNRHSLRANTLAHELIPPDLTMDLINFLSDDSVSVAEKKTEIVADFSRDEPASQNMVQGFIDLKKNIEAFQTEWKRFVNKIAGLDKTISESVDTLRDLNAKVDTIDLGLTNPLLQKPEAIAERDDIQRAIARNASEREQVEAALTPVKQITAALADAQNKFTLVSTRIIAFANIRAYIRADMQSILEILDSNDSPDSNALLKARLKAMSKTYNALRKALLRYETALDPSLAVNIAA